MGNYKSEKQKKKNIGHFAVRFMANARQSDYN
jgi:hypothetical protein